MTRESVLLLLKNNQLQIGQTYVVSNATSLQIPISLIATATSILSKVPERRTLKGIEFESEYYDILTDKLTCVDTLSCVLRCENSHWNFIQDTGHQPIKIKNVQTLQGKIQVNYARSYDKVLSHSLSLDETYSRNELCICAGSSVGISHSLIEIYKTIIHQGKLQRVLAFNQELSIPGSNIWFTVQCCKIF
ncbi:MAG: hypothetical protein KA198_04320 [Chitinophagaceae bacterium]|nr:hypothetical protein [Chitinophagaceae bacterium]